LQQPPEEADLIQAVLEEKRGGRVRLHVPVRGEKRRLMTMVAENAAQTFRLTRAQRLAGQDALAAALGDLQDALNLPRLPQRIECYDISNIRGTDAVGSMVVFQDGRPKKAHYRRFKIRSVGEIDDYAMMREVLTRRFGRMAAQSGAEASGEPAWGIVPDLVLIDGGRGHLSTAHQALLDLGVSTDVVPLASLAKEREELFALQSAEPILLPRDAQALFLVQQIRDEAHRFAISYHQKLRSRRATRSALDQVSGIGPKRRRMLIRHFGSLQGVRRASLDELAALPGMTRELAQRIKELT
ncbi:MAG: helix-hairpin-helix domain-containing protein, partial [Chloroflexota bacterium]|nr:helix-hairpin-helix domain-containing protein [Chloroflexota bacterium]